MRFGVILAKTSNGFDDEHPKSGNPMAFFFVVLFYRMMMIIIWMMKDIMEILIDKIVHKLQVVIIIMRKKLKQVILQHFGNNNNIENGHDSDDIEIIRVTDVTWNEHTESFVTRYNIFFSNDEYSGYASYQVTISIGGSSAIANDVFMSVEAYLDDDPQNHHK